MKANTGLDIECPDCLDAHISILGTRDNDSSLHAISDASLALFSGNQYSFEPFNLVEVQPKHLALPPSHETNILACVRATVLLI